MTIRKRDLRVLDGKPIRSAAKRAQEAARQPRNRTRPTAVAACRRASEPWRLLLLSVRPGRRDGNGAPAPHARRVRTGSLAAERSGAALDRLQPEHLEDFYGRLLVDGLSAGTVLKTHRVISRALHVAHRRGRVARNVARLVDPPRYRRAEVDPLSASEARQILEAAKSRRNTARWTVAFALGLRQGEALGLQWEHVDLEAGTLRVAYELQRLTWLHGCEDPEQCGMDLKPIMRARRCPKRRGGGLVIREPKSEKSKRTVVLPGSLLDQLRTHREQQNAERETAGSAWINWEGRSLVFARPDGHPIDPREDWGEWKDLLAAAGVRDARLHDARHTAATLLQMSGVASAASFDGSRECHGAGV